MSNIDIPNNNRWNGEGFDELRIAYIIVNDATIDRRDGMIGITAIASSCTSEREDAISPPCNRTRIVANIFSFTAFADDMIVDYYLLE